MHRDEIAASILKKAGAAKKPTDLRPERAIYGIGFFKTAR